MWDILTLTKVDNKTLISKLASYIWQKKKKEKLASHRLMVL